MSNVCEKAFNAYTPEERLRALRYYFGRPEASAEDLSTETGLSPNDLLSRSHGDGGQGHGFFGVRTCSLEWRRNTLAPQHQGDWPWWRDVIRAFWVTGPLDGVDPRYSTNHAH